MFSSRLSEPTRRTPSPAGSTQRPEAIRRPHHTEQENSGTAHSVVREGGPQWGFDSISIVPAALEDLGSVHDVPRSTGQALDPATRAHFEPRFGHDFSRVRVHTGPAAARSAQDLEASAYTVGPNIVFGAGQFLPQTAAGRRLLSHELTHVVQQARSPARATRGLSAPGDWYERQAEAAADALMQGGDIAGVLNSASAGVRPAVQRNTPQAPSTNPAQTAPAQQPPPRPFDYDRGVYHIPPVPPGLTAEMATEQLNQRVKAGAITSFVVKGVAAGSHNEVFLLALLYWVATPDARGTEAHIVTAIDWPSNPRAAAPQGRVIVRIDSNGAASAELIDASHVPAIPQTTFADATARLVSDFGFATVTGWSGTKPVDAEELSDVLAALELLKKSAPRDIPALKGVDLIRVPTLTGKEAGEFFANDNTPGNKPWLKLADTAFSVDKFQFAGGDPASSALPASFQIILHEVGHAVETEELRSARQAHSEAQAELDQARKQLAGEATAGKAEFEEAKRKHTLPAYWKKQEKTHKKNEEAEKKASAKEHEAGVKLENTRIAASAIQPLEADAAAQSTAAASALADAKNALAALRADEIQGSAAYVRAIDDAAAAITLFGQDAKAGHTLIDLLEETVFQKIVDRDHALFELEKAQNIAMRDPAAHAPVNRSPNLLNNAVTAQDAWLEAERVLAHARGRTRRLQKFIDLVNANNIRRFTQYSVENWTLHPEEFYAEAYSLWLADPQFVRTNYKVVFDFFDKGDYRN